MSAIFWMLVSLGKPPSVDAMAICKAFSGKTLADCKTYTRSKMMARANMEQAMRGQMGHPAACMMLIKIKLSTSGFSFDYG